MHHRFPLKRLTICVGATIFILSGCGGGGSGTTTAAPTPTPVAIDADVTLSGTASTGAPMKAATVQLLDANGIVIETVVAGDDGSYVFTSFKASKYKAPFVVAATGIVGDSKETLVSAYPTAESAIVNVNPITHGIVATLTNGNPIALITDTKSLSASISKSALDASEKGFHDALADNLTAAGVSGNLLNTKFDSAQDKLLDNVKVQVKPDGSIEISSLAGSTADDLGNSATKPADSKSVVLARGVVPSAALKANLPAPAASAIIGISVTDTFVNAMNACFKLPVAGRGTYAAPLGACNVKLVVSSPAYKNNGYSGTQQIGSLLTSSAMDNAEFLKPEIIRQLAADRAQIKFAWRRADGVLGSIVTVTQKDTDGVWRLVGNQRDYEVNINGAVTRRQSINGINTSRYETGFNLYVRDDGTVTQAVISGSGLPAGGVTLKHRAGCDFLSLAKPDGTTTGCSSLYRVRAAKLDGSAYTPTSSNAHLFASPYLADADITAMTPGSLYQIVITPNSGPSLTYWNRLRSRPYTVAELTKVNFIDLVSTNLLTTGSVYAGGGKPTVQWKNNPLGAPAYNISFFHDQGSDNVNVNYTINSVQVPCNGNANCDGSSGNYLTIANPASDVFQLTGRNRFDTQVFSSYMP